MHQNKSYIRVQDMYIAWRLAGHAAQGLEMALDGLLQLRPEAVVGLLRLLGSLDSLD